MEETRVPGEIHRPVSSPWQTWSHNVVSSTPWTGFELTTSMVLCTDCTGSCKSNYHTITTTTVMPIDPQYASSTSICYWFPVDPLNYPYNQQLLKEIEFDDNYPILVIGDVVIRPVIVLRLFFVFCFCFFFVWTLSAAVLQIHCFCDEEGNQMTQWMTIWWFIRFSIPPKWW